MILPTLQLADLLGLTPRRIGQLHQDGIAIRTAPGKYDAARSIQNYVAHVAAKAETRAADLDLEKERARLAAEQADGHALKNAQMRGKLVEADEVEREWQNIMRGVRAGVLAVTSRIRQRIPGLPTSHADIIDRELRDALTALADDITEDPDGSARSASTTETTSA